MARQPKKKERAAPRRGHITPAAIENFFNFGIELSTRTLYVGSHVSGSLSEAESGVDAKMAEHVTKGLILCAAADREREITIIMNNIGGDLTHGWAIYDAIAHCPCPTTMHIFGYAMSMGCVVLQAANKRLIAPRANIMVHYGSAIFGGSPEEMDAHMKDWKRNLLKIEDVFFKRMQEKDPQFKREKLKELMKKDSYMDAQEAVDLGLADEIIELPS